MLFLNFLFKNHFAKLRIPFGGPESHMGVLLRDNKHGE